ncbi:MAG TPA: hypothetical protein VJQ85_01940, partial [Gaiellaceae bacterium]|nr:hypothetical protein [Gaiellaceae bacterium]
MTVQAVTETPSAAPGISIEALAALARAVADAAARPSLAEALHDLASAARAGSGAEAAVVRVASGDELEVV